MKRLAVLSLVLLLIGACSVNLVRGSGDLVTESRSVRGFDRVTATTSGELIITQGETESLTVETDDNIIDDIITEVEGGTLTLKGRPGTSHSPTRLTYNLAVRDLAGVKVTGSVDVSADSFSTDQLEISVSGSGDVRIGSLTAQSLQLRISGSGDVELAGQVARQTVALSGSGKYEGADLASTDTELVLTGSGNAVVWVTGWLTGRISGSGSASYYGEPDVDMSDTGTGSLRARGSK